MKKEKCPCGSKKDFSECCELYISGKQSAQTPEALMRSRYSAYTKGNISYIQKTMCGTASQGFNANKAKKWAKKSHWLGLKVIKIHQENRKKGYVEFIARYRIKQKENKIRECSEFHYIDNCWYYVDGKMIS